MDDERYESDDHFADSIAESICRDGVLVGDGIAVAVERCPLCLRSRRPIYCVDCVNTGNFSTRYLDLQKKLASVSSERSKLVERIRQRVAPSEIRAAKRDEIEELKTRIRLLKWSLKEASKKKSLSESYYNKKRKVNKHDAEKVRKSHDVFPRMRATFEGSMGKVQKKRTELGEKHAALQVERCRVINDLTRYIFPVVELTAEDLEGSSLLVSTMSRQLSEACQLAYMSGQWVHTDHDGNTLIKIVESTLPGNGDYSAGVMSDHQELASLAEDEERFASTNPRWEVISGLHYTTQLVKLLSGILHVALPRKISYSTFGEKDLNERELNQAVGQLNHSMLHLCFSQGVDPSQMIARHTMHNLLLLLNSEHLGKEQAFVDDLRMVEAVNDGCKSEEDSDEDEVDPPPPDWDFVIRCDFPEVQVPAHVSASWAYNPAAYAGQMLSGTQSTASGLVTSAAASVASLWRTATGGRSGDS